MKAVRYAVVAAMVAGLLSALPAAGLEDAPVVAYSAGKGVRVATVSGKRLAQLPDLRHYSLDGGMLVGTTQHNNIAAFNARTGERRFTVKDGVLPTVLDRRGRVAFWATNARDKWVNSVWVREISGRVRKIVQFSSGGPGYDPGLDGENTILSTSFDQTGAKMAIAQGNDVDLFIHDVFVVDVETGRVTRITDDRRSRWPAISPKGRRVVYQRDLGACDADHIRASRLVVESARGKSRRFLTGGSCDRWFANARWVTPEHVVAYRTSRVDGELGTDLVMINVATGKRRLLTQTNDIVLFSAGEGRVAYERETVDGFTILDVTTGGSTVVPRGTFAHMTGDRGTL